MNDIVRAAGLHTYYGASHIIRGVDIHISRGESIGLLGRNGMGKTTLIRSILGHVRPTKGYVEVQGEDCTGRLPEQIARQGIAYVPEGRGIFPNLTVEENLVMAARPSRNGCSNWTLERILSLFPRLKERLRSGGQQLSGGEQQMLAIGSAVNGDTGNQAALIKAMESARIDSPRGSFTISRTHNPIQDIYVRQVRGLENRYAGVAVKGLEDPGSGCRL